MRRVTATEARVHLGELLRAVTDRGEAIGIEQHGKLTAVLVPPSAIRQHDDPAPAAQAWQEWWRLCEQGPALPAESWRALVEESYER